MVCVGVGCVVLGVGGGCLCGEVRVGWLVVVVGCVCVGERVGGRWGGWGCGEGGFWVVGRVVWCGFWVEWGGGVGAVVCVRSGVLRGVGIGCGMQWCDIGRCLCCFGVGVCRGCGVVVGVWCVVVGGGVGGVMGVAGVVRGGGFGVCVGGYELSLGGVRDLVIVCVFGRVWSSGGWGVLVGVLCVWGCVCVVVWYGDVGGMIVVRGRGGYEWVYVGVWVTGCGLEVWCVRVLGLSVGDVELMLVVVSLVRCLEWCWVVGGVVVMRVGYIVVWGVVLGDELGVGCTVVVIAWRVRDCDGGGCVVGAGMGWGVVGVVGCGGGGGWFVELLVWCGGKGGVRVLGGWCGWWVGFFLLVGSGLVWVGCGWGGGGGCSGGGGCIVSWYLVGLCRLWGRVGCGCGEVWLFWRGFGCCLVVGVVVRGWVEGWVVVGLGVGCECWVCVLGCLVVSGVDCLRCGVVGGGGECCGWMIVYVWCWVVGELEAWLVCGGVVSLVVRWVYVVCVWGCGGVGGLCGFGGCGVVGGWWGGAYVVDVGWWTVRFGGGVGGVVGVGRVVV
uniref:Uncharacterized protein n=1 Tax=Knipowitschia caucasica TaxID=637954 RepID=A0AAV2LCE3_KNICA